MSFHDLHASFDGYEPLFKHSDRRRFQRVQIDLFGRYMLESKAEHHCRTVDISIGGMKLVCAVKPEAGEKVVVYIDALGRFSGKVARTHEDGFSIAFDAPARKREMLADKLTWFANRMTLGLDDQRRHERIEPFQKFAVLRLSAGDEHIVRIRDLSASGVSVETSCLPSIGERVSIGNAYANIVRHFDGGFAAEFLTPFASDQIDEATRL
ncbi:PilZ domain-containing protein [Methylocystis sp. JAN1]|uniref:PilZ domain-containing protein n=1 Tax=Methylocystis sp. JAN1 TaxID=3397211 RepID=UPI003FA1E4F6